MAGIFSKERLLGQDKRVSGVVVPISPEEVTTESSGKIPSFVIDTFNALIVINFSGGKSRVSQDQVLEVLGHLGASREQIFSNGWLQVGKKYQDAGWDVVYEPPSVESPYSCSFVFRPPEKASTSSE